MQYTPSQYAPNLTQALQGTISLPASPFPIFPHIYRDRLDQDLDMTIPILHQLPKPPLNHLPQRHDRSNHLLGFSSPDSSAVKTIPTALLRIC